MTLAWFVWYGIIYIPIAIPPCRYSVFSSYAADASALRFFAVAGTAGVGSCRLVGHGLPRQTEQNNDKERKKNFHAAVHFSPAAYGVTFKGVGCGHSVSKFSTGFGT
jgi:hypothetical protein